MTIFRWALMLLLLITAGVAFIFYGLSIKDPFAELPTSSADPLTGGMALSLYFVPIIYVIGVIVCVGAIVWKLIEKMRT